MRIWKILGPIAAVVASLHALGGRTITDADLSRDGPALTRLSVKRFTLLRTDPSLKPTNSLKFK